MTLHYKTGGAWVQVQRPYVKRNGVWTPVKQTWRKAGGTWVKHFEWDITPPSPPSLQLDLIGTSDGRYINVSVNIPGAHDPNVKMIRVLTSTTAYPATQFGGLYYSTPDSTYPKEPWSDYFYGTGGSHTSTATQVAKQYPINRVKPNIAAGTYYFSSWTLDVNGNWSARGANAITVPKTGLGSNVVTREAHFQADYSGSYVVGTGFVTGDVKQSSSPQSRGMYFYGSDITALIGSHYGNSHATITNAQMYLSRIDTDGQPTANVYIFRHGYGTPGDITTTPVATEITKLGTLAKGESKWFTIPSSYHADLISGNTKGLGFYYKNPTNAAGFAQDYSVLAGIREDNRRLGELYVHWYETP